MIEPFFIIKKIHNSRTAPGCNDAIKMKEGKNIIRIQWYQIDRTSEVSQSQSGFNGSQPTEHRSMKQLSTINNASNFKQ